MATSTIPAYAASRCAVSFRSSSGFYSLTPSDPGYSASWLEYRFSFGRVTVYGLGTDAQGKPITVTSIVATQYLSYNDFRWLNNTTGTGNGGQIRLSNGRWTAASSTAQNFYFWDEKNSGFSRNQVEYKQYGAMGSTGPAGNDTPHDYMSYTNRWSSTDANPYNRVPQYTTDANGCRTFVLPELGEFSFREPRATTLYNDERWRDWTEYTVTLSDGTILHWATWDPTYTPEFGPRGRIFY